jgi:hypothetical protein
MFVDLMAEVPAGERYAEAARGWLDGVLEEVFPDLREGLRTRPSTRRISRHWDDGPDGEPGQFRGTLEVGMTARRSRMTVFTETAWQRFLGSLGTSPATAALNIRVVGEDGYLSGTETDIRVTRPDEEPGWVRFTFSAPSSFIWQARTAGFPRPDAAVVQVLRWVPGCDEQQVVERDAGALQTVLPGPGGGWFGSAELQDRWAEAVKGQAERIGACAGMITGRGGGPGPYETVTYPDWPPEMVLQPPEYVQEVAMLGAGLDVLYRYAWVTIIPPEIAGRLGGPAALTDSGAFLEVSELAGGSVWLRATRTLEEFDESRSAAVAAALVPVLVAATIL